MTSHSVPASQSELNKFVRVVDEFKAKYAKLISPKMRNDVYASKNAAMIGDYETLVSRGRVLNSTIDNLVGAWNAFKRGYSNVTNVTSTVIGDAIDTVRGWFGYDANAGLGALQIPAAVVIIGIVAAATALITAMNRIFISVEASRIQRENPNVSRTVALRRAKAGLPSFLPGGFSMPMIAAGGVALWLIFRGK